MYLIVVHELCVFGSHFYVVIMSCLAAVHVDYYHVVDASIFWLKTISKYVLIHSCKQQENRLTIKELL
jgi:hypothetical protein